MAAWMVYSLLALLLWGVWGILNKVATSRLPSWMVFSVELLPYLMVGGIVWGLSRGPVVWNGPGLAAAMAAGLSGGVALFFFLKALASGPASVVVPLTSLYPVITVLLGVTLLGETLTGRHVAGILLAMGAVWLLSK